MKKIMHLLLLSCLKATELIEKKFHFELSVKEKLQLKIHTMMCEACSKYEKQSIFLEKAIAFIKNEEASTKDIDDLKQKINNRLNLNDNLE
jgi:hypothetical protein